MPKRLRNGASPQTDIETLKKNSMCLADGQLYPSFLLPFITIELSQPLWVAGAHSKREAGLPRPGGKNKGDDRSGGGDSF